jgi:hypothetical protein
VLPSEILRQLHRLARRAGLEVREEAFDLKVIEGKGGLCRLRGKPVVVMDVGLPVVDKIGVLADALATFGIEPLYVPPLLRARASARAAALARSCEQLRAAGEK